MSAGSVLFDLDGCLVDSRPGIVRSVNVALVQHGLPEQRMEDLLFLIGPPLDVGFRDLLTRLGGDPAHVASMVDAYRADYVDALVDGTTPMPGMPGLLDDLAAAGLTLGVVTTKPLAFARPILEHLGLADRFAVVAGPSLALTEESKVVTLGRALDEASIDPDSAWMVGDRHHDVDAGRAHGLRTAGVTWGFGSRHELEVAGADVVVDTPDELRGVVVPR